MNNPQYVTFPCVNCNRPAVFTEDPYSVKGTSRYWKSAYKKPAEYLIIVERKTPIKKKNRKIAIRTTHEYVIEVYCDANCSLAQNNATGVDSH